MGETYNQLAALSSQNKEYILECDRLREERDTAWRNVESAEHEIRHLQQQLEDERRRYSAAQETPRQWQNTPLSSTPSSAPTLFPPNPSVPSFSFPPSSIASSTANPPMRTPTIAASGLLTSQGACQTNPVPTHQDIPIPSISASSTSTSGPMLPPPLIIGAPVTRDELRIACHKEHERNKQIKQRKQRFITENERKRQGVGVPQLGGIQTE